MPPDRHSAHGYEKGDKAMSSRVGNDEPNWSRRRLMSVLAAAASTTAVLVATTSPARADDWQEYHSLLKTRVNALTAPSGLLTTRQRQPAANDIQHQERFQGAGSPQT